MQNRHGTLHDPAPLLAPLQPGDELSPGIKLRSVSHTPFASDLREEALHLSLGDGLTLSIHPDDGGRAHVRSARFCVRIDHDGTLSTAQQAAVDRVCACLLANDPPHTGPAWEPERPSHPGGVLWLVPGHIGNPLDLSIRAVEVLRTADRLFVEEGSQDAIARIYRSLMLGTPPPCTELPSQKELLVSQLREGVSAGQVMALFGADEGVPTITDPGGELLDALSALSEPPQLLTISAGSALSTAQLRAPGRGGFRFWGSMEHTSGRRPMIRGLRRGLVLTRTHVALSTGGQLRQVWPALRRLWWRRGRLVLLKELTRDTEQVWSAKLNALPSHPPDGFGQDEAVVVQVLFG